MMGWGVGRGSLCPGATLAAILERGGEGSGLEKEVLGIGVLQVLRPRPADPRNSQPWAWDEAGARGKKTESASFFAWDQNSYNLFGPDASSPVIQ